jgi:branched-chain amino acid aminotransferase
MKVKFSARSAEQLKIPPASMSGVIFGTVFSDHMFCMEWEEGKGWHNAEIKPYGPLILEPSSMVLHYAQMSFEGLKAYQTDSGEHVLFRPRENFKRMNRTSLRMCLPELDVEEVLTTLKKLLRLDSGWVPYQAGTSLYIRPTILATEEAIGLKVSSKYLFFIILSPVGPYYPQGFNPVKIMVSEKYVRAVPGGVGYAKTGGNYAASILAEKEAKELGYTQVLWLDAVERRYIEEVGSMNIFFLINEEIVTPQLTGSILPGITRMSVLELGKHWGLKVSERRVSIDEILKGLKDGSVTEIFGSGTAAVISPVGVLSYKGEECQVGNGETGPITSRFYEQLTGIQYGKVADPFDWVESI